MTGLAIRIFGAHVVSMENFSAWVKWHGPYRSKRAWEKAALGLSTNDRVRLYMALGRWKMLSIANSRPLYIGLNSKDSEGDVAGRLQKHIDPSQAGESSHYKISGLLNEYWLGEVLTRWHCDDSHHQGVTKDIETALIFSIAPIINTNGVKNAPEYGFQIVNEIARKSWWRHIIKSRFEHLVFSLYKYDPVDGAFTVGDISTSRRKQQKVASIEAARMNRVAPKTKHKNPIAYRIFGAEKQARHRGFSSGK